MVAFCGSNALFLRPTDLIPDRLLVASMLSSSVGSREVIHARHFLSDVVLSTVTCRQITPRRREVDALPRFSVFSSRARNRPEVADIVFKGGNCENSPNGE
jgi:hypothetical protein